MRVHIFISFRAYIAIEFFYKSIELYPLYRTYK